MEQWALGFQLLFGVWPALFGGSECVLLPLSMKQSFHLPRSTRSFLSCVVTVGVVFMMIDSCSLSADTPPRLQVSDNGRFLVREDGSAFFPLADTAWQIAWRLKRHEIEVYLDHRCRQGFNTIAMVAFPMDGEVTANPYGDQPFAVAGTQYDPLQPLTTPGCNPKSAAEYDYWDHVEFVIDAAAARQMYVVLLPA